jgi:UDP-N-acetylmuramoyl-L-alanyl-D-glutamate--2,6-diaminopimelate ligase
MRLKQLLRGVEIIAWNVDEEMEISGVSYDSRAVRPGEAFVALAGYETDGHAYIAKALQNGAACIICEENRPAPSVRVMDSRKALAAISSNWFDAPGCEMTMVGVTGTNGKTTTTYMLKTILEEKAGAKVGLIGTNQNMIGTRILPAERTTPESYEIQKLLRQMADAGCSHVVMEVSSHALAQERVCGIPYAVGIFTNLTRDHLDYHGTMENYCDAKAKLFSSCGVAVVNGDDPWMPRLLANARCRRFTFGVKSPADLTGKEIQTAPDHIAFTAEADTEWTKVRVGIPGGFTVYNALGALSAAWNLGVPLSEAAAALGKMPGVKGRVEVLPTPGKEYTIIADYAHTPDALENVLQTVRGFAKGRVVTLFGCGGDRDRTKRPQMGKIAADLSDFVIVTTDNPRREEPMAIINEILAGMNGTATPYGVVVDRVEAIHYAMDHAQPGDVIALCGKGHEDYQIVGTEKHHLDEREIVADYLKK